jgi:hypothetical protein
MDRMMVERLPVRADPPGDPPQEVTGQMRHFDPGQDQIPGVVSNEMKVVPIGFLGRSDELIAQVDLARGRTPAHAGHRSCSRQDQIFEMFPHRTAVAQVVIAAEQMGEEFFSFSPAHQTNLQRPQRCQGFLDGSDVVGLDLGHAPMSNRVIDGGLSFGGQFDMPGSMQRQHQSPADHVAGLAVGLNPVPGFAHFDRESAPAQVRVPEDELPQESDVGFTDLTTAKTEQHIGHAAKFSRRDMER